MKCIDEMNVISAGNNTYEKSLKRRNEPGMGVVIGCIRSNWMDELNKLECLRV